MQLVGLEVAAGYVILYVGQLQLGTILKLHQTTLEARQQYLSICSLYDAYTQRNLLCFDQYCTFNTATSTRSHRLPLVPPTPTINARRYLFFVELLTSSDLSDY